MDSLKTGPKVFGISCVKIVSLKYYEHIYKLWHKIKETKKKQVGK